MPRAPSCITPKWAHANTSRHNQARRCVQGLCKSVSRRWVTSTALPLIAGSMSQSPLPFISPSIRLSSRWGACRQVFVTRTPKPTTKARCQSISAVWAKWSGDDVAATARQPGIGCTRLTLCHHCGHLSISMSKRHTDSAFVCRRKRLMRTKRVACMAQGRVTALEGSQSLLYAAGWPADAAYARCRAEIIPRNQASPRNAASIAP